jgi:hypothetical protein
MGTWTARRSSPGARNCDGDNLAVCGHQLDPQDKQSSARVPQARPSSTGRRHQMAGLLHCTALHCTVLYGTGEVGKEESPTLYITLT